MTPNQRPTQISPVARREAFDRAGGRCNLCAQPLVAYEVHHLIFQSHGGEHTPDNLLALCPNCHANFPHRLFLPEEWPLVAAAGARLHAATELERSMPAASGWRQRAVLLGDAHVRENALLHGLYALVYELAERVLSEALAQSEDDHRLITKMAVLASDMAYYRGETRGWLERLSALESRFMSVGVDDRELLTSLRLSKSRLLRQLGRVEEEADVLHACTPNGVQCGEHQFRLVSLALYSEYAYRTPSDELERDYGIGPTMLPMDRISIAGDRARLLVLAGETERAYRGLASVFMSARLMFFRRNMHATALSLAKVALDLGEPQWAAEWLGMAAQFAAVGIGATLSVEGVRADIIATAGEIPLRGVVHDAAALGRLANRLGDVKLLVE